MTAVDKTAASDAEFRARIAPFEAADEPAEVVDAVVDNIASRYRDPTLARFAINDFRDWLTTRAMPSSRAEEAHGPGKCVSVEEANRVLAEERSWAADAIRAADAPLAGQHSTDEEGR